MPNYIKNRLTIIGNTKDVFAFVKSKETVFDFNKIIPMPKELEIEDSSTGDLVAELLLLKGMSSFPNQRKINEIEKRLYGYNQLNEAMDLGKKYIANIAKYGHKTWYGWRSENWGTKWNAIEPSVIAKNCIQFDTAWAGVIKLIEKLSTIFPESTFEYKYSDEDTGCNCGRGTIKNGVSEMEFPENYSREAYELAFELRPDNAKYYKLEDGHYVNKEDEE
jgi:hypothetical protein